MKFQRLTPGHYAQITLPAERQPPMGMFDYLRCKYPLPHLQDAEYQTKDTPSQFMDQYEIREDGTLWHEVYDLEDRSDPNAEGLMRIVGMGTRVNKRWLHVSDIHGEIRFYTDLPGRKGWIEYSVYFVWGTLNQLHLVKYETGQE